MHASYGHTYDCRYQAVRLPYSRCFAANLTIVCSNMVITRNLGDHFAPQPKDYLASRTYIPLPKL